ncbi:MAG: hypothetical protein K8R63_03020 [Bacteroidales bacterium]|nr:hypothetical protein [Bacteroidales bacterium]
MALSKARKKWLIISGSVLLILIILLIILNSILSNKADHLLREKLSSIDTTSYHVDFRKVRVNVFTRSVNVYDITVKPADSALQVLRNNRLAPPLFQISVPKLKVGGVSIMKAIKGKDIKVGKIILTEPDIKVYSTQGLFSKKKSSSGNKSIFSSDTIVESPVKEASLGTFEIRNAHIQAINLSKDKTVLETSELNILVDDLWLHQAEGDTLSHVLDISDCRISFASHQMDLPGNFYSVQTGPLEISYKDKEIRLDSIQLIPAYSQKQFGRMVGKQTDRFDLKIAQILVSGLEFDSLVNKKLIIDNIDITGPHADIYRDKGIPRDMKHFPKLYQTAVADIPIYVKIGKINIIAGYVKYQEMKKGGSVPGRVMFDQLEVTVEGVSNDAEMIREGLAIKVDGRGLLMGKTKAFLHLDFPVGDPLERFTFYGSTEAFAVNDINPMVEPLANFRAIGGTVNSVSYYAMAYNDTAFGRIEFLYNDLEISILKKQKESKGQIDQNRFLSFLAGSVIHKANPLKDKPHRISKMFFVRDLNKGFFNYMWKTIQNGLTNAVTPGKKKLTTDMSWPEFSNNWQKVLLDDRKLMHPKKAKTKKNKQKNRK